MNNKQLKHIKRMVDIIQELNRANKLSYWQKFLNFFRKNKKEHIVMNEERQRVLIRKVRQLKERLHVR